MVQEKENQRQNFHEEQAALAAMMQSCYTDGWAVLHGDDKVNLPLQNDFREAKILRGLLSRYGYSAPEGVEYLTLSLDERSEGDTIVESYRIFGIEVGKGDYQRSVLVIERSGGEEQGSLFVLTSSETAELFVLDGISLADGDDETEENLSAWMQAVDDDVDTAADDETKLAEVSELLDERPMTYHYVAVELGEVRVRKFHEVVSAYNSLEE